MSLFARAAGRGTHPHKSLKPKNITRAVGVKGYAWAELPGLSGTRVWKWLLGLGLGDVASATKARASLLHSKGATFSRRGCFAGDNLHYTWSMASTNLSPDL